MAGKKLWVDQIKSLERKTGTGPSNQGQEWRLEQKGGGKQGQFFRWEGREKGKDDQRSDIRGWEGRSRGQHQTIFNKGGITEGGGRKCTIGDGKKKSRQRGGGHRGHTKNPKTKKNNLGKREP